MIAYLRLLSNPCDGLSLRRVINSPPRGIGEKMIEKIGSLARERGVSLFEGFRAGVEEGEFSAAVRGRVAEFLGELMDALRREKDTLLPGQIALDLLGRTGYLPRLREEGTEEAFSRIENLEELVNVITEFEGGRGSHARGLPRQGLLGQRRRSLRRPGEPGLLMTVHCAKGLEFPVVFVVGLEEGIFPHARRGEESEDLEEERRLFYVALTRARERLFLSRARRRMTFGTGRSNLPSRFLQEIPGELIAWEGGMRWKKKHVTSSVGPGRRSSSSRGRRSRPPLPGMTTRTGLSGGERRRPSRALLRSPFRSRTGRGPLLPKSHTPSGRG